MDRTFSLPLLSTFSESEKIPDFVDHIRDECNLDEEKAETFKLVLSEAVTNAIVHGNKQDESKSVDVSVTVANESISADVIDEGEGFDHDQETNPLEEENLLETSGRGVFLIREFADYVEFKKNGTHTHFRINLNGV